MLSNDQFVNKGRYRIVNTFEQDGTGGMYEAYDTVSNTTVVLKETVGSLGKVTTSSQMEAINSAFLGGAKTLTEIKHESLISVQDYFADIDRQYLVLEPVTGFDLKKFLEPGEQRPPLSDVLSWADQLLDALQYLHTLVTPIIHGDIRPENVKLTSNSTVKLLTSCPHTDSTPSSEDSGVNYRPLEQLWDGLDALSQRVILNHYDEESERWLLQPLSAATDLYSLGATLYCVLTGTVPPDALDRSIAALECKPDPLTDPAELNPAVPPEISDVILKSMSLRREDRFYSAVILRQILHTAAARVKEREAKELPDHLDLQIIEESPKDDPPAGIQNLLSAEERRLQIEAEQERLENERMQLEKRRLELDAEMEHQRAEQERMEREAEEARQKLDQHRLEAAEQERNHLENEQKQREKDEARELAAKIMAEKENEAEPALLELELVETPAVAAVDLSDLLDVPENSMPDENIAIDLSADNEKNTMDFEMPGSDYQASSSKWRVPAIAVVVVLLAGAAVGIWKMTTSNSAAASTSVAAQPISIPQQTDIQPPVSDDRNSTEPTQSPAAQTPTVSTVPETVTPDKNTKPVQRNAVQDKATKPVAPAPAKTPAPKKAVTVDDLINDH